MPSYGTPRTQVHLTHGHPDITFSGSFYTSVQYDVDENGWIDIEATAKLARKHKPKIIVVGTTAYPRIFKWKKWRAIADSVGAYLLADISHIAGLVVGGVHPSPARYAARCLWNGRRSRESHNPEVVPEVQGLSGHHKNSLTFSL